MNPKIDVSTMRNPYIDVNILICKIIRNCSFKYNFIHFL